MKTSLPSIPVFKLYGENQAWPTPDLLHCESIPKRSSLHHWEIKPHRHADLFQLLYVQRGQAMVEVEGRRTKVLEASIQVTPPLTVHGFQFSENIEGYVLTLGAPLVAQLEAQLGAPLTVLASSGCYPVGRDRRTLNTLFTALHQEYEGSAPARDLLLHSLVNVLMVWISRQGLQNRQPSSRGERNQQLLSSFIKLVEQHYREHLSVEHFAHRVGLSSVHLNTLCRELAGQTALQIIHQRLLLEAKRSLIYTTMSISQLSDSLGFSDPTYFSRFFRRLSGQTPNAFRQAAGHHESGA
ncbi:AraC family transcriptional regulator [Pseudomonas sp. FFUP_PS_473]|jgi:AraC family transcriptional activator of pobA|uniref:helix-turn-helix domain-containing protein n=1 Tax=Pseudomonas TaxID=286 RepID=UPI0008117281|nr:MULTISPECIES: helix-turn-helix domain-containing protein [Pseudomonas]MEE3635356.1 helix-turn-helix domain-containing protein [Pseudomonas sp. AL 58]PLP88006.1 AraC family transcriptional regulator [Pseudomonas sp. FFUP_PS_473]WJM94778.1 helix-turn-helix domain-containing protein [Pseudomonas defluvii]